MICMVWMKEMLHIKAKHFMNVKHIYCEIFANA